MSCCLKKRQILCEHLESILVSLMGSVLLSLLALCVLFFFVLCTMLSVSLDCSFLIIVWFSVLNFACYFKNRRNITIRLIKTQILNLVRTARFWNNLHQVRSKQLHQRFVCDLFPLYYININPEYCLLCVLHLPPLYTCILPTTFIELSHSMMWLFNLFLLINANVSLITRRDNPV